MDQLIQKFSKLDLITMMKVDNQSTMMLADAQGPASGTAV
jgi:hypothetical protein